MQWTKLLNKTKILLSQWFKRKLKISKTCMPLYVLYGSKKTA